MVAAICVQDEEIVIMVDDNEATLTDDENGNLFQHSSSKEELGTE